MRNLFSNILPFCSSSQAAAASGTESDVFNPEKYNFKEKTVLVTGSSSGIGAAIAIQLAQYGANVTITGRSSKALKEVSRKIKKLSSRDALVMVGDLNDDAFVSKLVTETVQKFGKLDVLINNAGHSTTGGTLDSENLMEAYDELIMLNVRSVILLSQLAMPELEKTKGNIINISSIVGLRSFQNIPLVYSTSKAALDMVTKCSALELGPKGIRVNSVNPGAVATGFGRSMGNDNFYKENEESIRAGTVLGRIGQADDIANLVCFLASDAAKNITGSIMVCDAGSLIK